MFDIIITMTNTKTAISRYLDAIKIGKSPNTYMTYSQALKKFYQIVGNVPITVDVYIKFLKATKDSSPSTKELQSTAILRMLNYLAADDETINLSVFERAKSNYIKKRGKRFPVFDQEALQKIIDYCVSTRGDLLTLRDRAFILTLADSGARISEACNLRRDDVDWKGKYAVIIGKGDKQGVIRFSDRAIDALNVYLTARQGLDGKTMKPLGSLPLFARHDKGAGSKIKPVQSGGMWFAIKELAKKAGVDPHTIRPHDFRHYFVTAIWQKTGDIKLAQELARHEDIGTTSRYTHIGGRIARQYDDIFNDKTQ